MQTMFDFTCKYLVQNFSTSFAAWLLGKPIEMTQLEPTELSLDPIRADSVMFLEADNTILHIEFQTRPDPKIPFRMLDYFVRIYRQFPEREIHQVVIYLKPSRSLSVYQSTFEQPHTRHEFHIIRLWEQPTEPFLSEDGLLPFAALAKTEDKVVTLEKMASQIAQITDSRLRGNLATSAGILSTLVLEEDLVNTVLRRSIMQDSTLYRSIVSEGLEEGRKEGREEGLEQGREEGRREMLLELLNMKLGALPEEVSAQVKNLSKSRLSDLKSALLSFETVSDLENWMQSS